MAADTVPLPEGTVTLLSTDLVGSTLINQRLGDEAATTLEREIADLAQAQVEKQRGVVITSAGDGSRPRPVRPLGRGGTHADPRRLRRTPWG